MTKKHKKENKPVDLETEKITDVLERYIKKIIKYAKKDFGIFSMVVTVIFTLGIAAVKCAFYCYYYAVFHVYNIDKCYMNISNENILGQTIMFATVVVIVSISNYILFFLLTNKSISTLKRIWYCIVYYCLEIIILLVYAMVIGKIDLKELLQEFFNSSVKELISLLVAVTTLWFLLNIYGIGLFIERKIFAREKKQEIVIKNRKNTYKRIVYMVMTVVITFSIQIAAIFIFTSSMEIHRKEYKIVIKECDGDTKNNSNTVFELGNSYVYLYPIVFENEDVYILSQLRKNEKNEVEVNYWYQNIIGKTDVETVMIEDIYKMPVK